MFIQHKKYYSFTLVFWQITLNIPSYMSLLFIIDIFHLEEASRFHCIWVVAAGSR